MPNPQAVLGSGEGVSLLFFIKMSKGPNVEWETEKYIFFPRIGKQNQTDTFFTSEDIAFDAQIFCWPSAQG